MTQQNQFRVVKNFSLHFPSHRHRTHTNPAFKPIKPRVRDKDVCFGHRAASSPVRLLHVFLQKHNFHVGAVCILLPVLGLADIVPH